MPLNLSKWRPFCPSLDVLTLWMSFGYDISNENFANEVCGEIYQSLKKIKQVEYIDIIISMG